MSVELSRYRHAIVSAQDIAPDHPDLLIETQGRLACYYAPFEHINRSAKVVLVGITPGAQQAKNALRALRKALCDGANDAEALAVAKRMASFSGRMRGTLVALLDRIGLHQILNLDSCSHLFEDRGDLVHFTSTVRNPVFIDGQDYSGNPSVLRVPMLKKMTESWLGEEIRQLPNALWVPLGKDATSVLQYFVALGQLHPSRVLDGLPHPSPANGERVAYFLGSKRRDLLSSRTDPDALDERLATLRSRLAVSTSDRDDVETPPSSERSDPEQSTIKRPLATRPSHGALSASVAQAEALLSGMFNSIKSGNKKVVGFETKLGRHLAIQRDVQCINVWTEDLDPPERIAPCERYAAHRPRHSNLASQAPRVATGKAARLWRLEDTAQLETLMAWYAHA